MKKSMKLIASVLAVMMLLACTVSAGKYDEVFNGLSFSEYALYEQGTLDALQLRAFAVDPNGKYYYGGLLNGGTPTVVQFDVASKNEVATYQFTEDGETNAYIKAIACDSRGYVYMGIANGANNGAVYFAICEQNGLNQVSWKKIEIENKVGINGACTYEKDGKVYLYFITNYDTDRIYCYDVTDVNNPTLNTAFGNGAGGGFVDLNETFSMQDANNIAIGPDGMLYMCATTGVGSKGDTVFKIDNKGLGMMASNSNVMECFGVTVVAEYVVVCTYQGDESMVYVLNDKDLSVVTTYTWDNAPGYGSNNFCQLGMIGDKLYMADQGPDAVLVSTPIVFPTPVVEEPAAEAPADAAADAEAPAAEAPAAAPAAAPKTADAGIVVAAVVMAAAAAVVLSKKH